MNRIIIIGNGFDKAHGLATGYRDFIDSYWTNFYFTIFPAFERWQAENYSNIAHVYPCEDEFVRFEVFEKKLYKATEKLQQSQTCPGPYDEVVEFIEGLNNSEPWYFKGSVSLTFKNKFFEHISGRCSLSNWVEILWEIERAACGRRCSYSE